MIENYPRKGWVRGGGMETVEMLKEIDLLRRQKEELQNQLSSLKSTSKIDKGLLKQGSDTLEIVLVSYPNPFDPDDGEAFSIKWTWNEIFKLIADSFMVPVPARRAESIIKDKIYDSRKDEGFRASEESAKTILLQFVALEYMDIRTNEVYQSGVESFYVLTKEGVDFYVSLKAQKK